VGIILLLAEIFIPTGALLMCGGASLITALLVFFIPWISVTMSVGIFILLILLISFRVRRIKSKRIPRSAQSSLIGSYGVLLEEIKPGELGKIAIHGTQWRADSYEVIAKGSRVMVIDQDNITLTVEKA
jgi:membrane protein implicated in regulation of membrane protease activity